MVRRILTLGAILTALAPAALAAPHSHAGRAKLDRELRDRADAPRGHSRVILRLNPGVSADEAIRGLRGTVGRRLASVGGQVVDVPDTALDTLAGLPGVAAVSLDRPVQGTLERTGATVGATFVQDTLGLDGSGVGVAIIDSGVANWHDDLGSNRVVRFVDFVNFQPAAYDDYGHGTHVAGIIAGDGHDSGGRRRGISPGATLLVEKVLDATGQGYISNVIAAIDYAIANRDALHLRVVNLSVAAGVYESYTTDPLTLAARRAVEAGLVVVSAAGNLGRGAGGRPQYGAIGAPGNAPWVITVGASNHNGTASRGDDTVAGFSSRGPSALDFQAKPDLVAPGVGIESLADAGTTLFNTKPLMRLWGTVATANEPYLSLSGTSMASPVVSGTIALMLQANPALTPNLVKAILQFTAESRPGYDALTQGAGFLNTRGAVEMAQSLATGTGLPLGRSTVGQVAADPAPWSRQVLWGNHRLASGEIRTDANAWRSDVMWGSTTAPDGVAIGLGTATTAEGDNIVWGTSCGAAECANIVWGTACGGADCRGVIWGSDCDTAECDAARAAGARPALRGAVREGDEIAWSRSGEREADGVVRSTLDEHDSIVWPALPARRKSSDMVATEPPRR